MVIDTYVVDSHLAQQQQQQQQQQQSEAQPLPAGAADAAVASSSSNGASSSSGSSSSGIVSVVSFYTLPSSVLGHEEHNELRAAYSFYTGEAAARQVLAEYTEEAETFVAFAQLGQELQAVSACGSLQLGVRMLLAHPRSSGSYLRRLHFLCMCCFVPDMTHVA
jgi:hypothetical protein